MQDTKRRRVRMVKAVMTGEAAPEIPVDASRSLSEQDVFGPVTERIVEPPFNLLTLAKLPEQSSELRQCVDAMVANVEGFGHRLACRWNTDRGTPDKVRTQIEDERVRLENLLTAVAEGMSFTELRRRTRDDLETTGNAYWEVIRSASNEIVGLKHLPSYQMRLGMADEGYTKTSVPTLQIQNGDLVLERRVIYRRFRTYVQGHLTIASTTRTGHVITSSRVAAIRWFKSFGDPRVFDNETGEVVPDDRIGDWERTGRRMPSGRQASEVIHWRIYSGRTPYGIPRYIGNTPGILGERKAAEVNLSTLSNNNVPSMILAVSNGMLTEETITRIEQFAETLQSDDNRSRFLIVEGEGAVEGEDAGHVKIDVKPLVDVQTKDALFTEYTKQCKDSIRRAFRLPPIFVGATEEYTRATAEASRRLADEQVFAPERREVDWLINTVLLSEMGFRYWRFESRTPNVTDNQELIGMLSAAERTGGVTPRISRQVVEDVFQSAVDAPALDPEKFDPDVPFSLTMAEAVKAQGGTAGPTEVNQTIAPVQPSADVAKAEYDRAVIRELLDLGDRASEEIRRALRARDN